VPFGKAAEEIIVAFGMREFFRCSWLLLWGSKGQDSRKQT